jgi:hypothetical protein
VLSTKGPSCQNKTPRINTRNGFNGEKDPDEDRIKINSKGYIVKKGAFFGLTVPGLV